MTVSCRPSTRSASIRCSSTASRCSSSRPRSVRKRGGVELGERRATPEAEGFAERRRSFSGLLTVRLVDEVFEPVKVELARGNLNRVAGCEVTIVSLPRIFRSCDT